MILLDAVHQSLKSLRSPDPALRELAIAYAGAIDAAEGDPAALAKFGPKLLAVLLELGVKPSVRSQYNGAEDRLAQLRAARSA